MPYCRKISVAVIVLLIALFGISAAYADVKDIPEWNIRPPEKPVSDIWLEDESISQQYGWDLTDQSSCYGGKQLTLNGGIAGDHTVSYAFDVKDSGQYLISISGQPVGTNFTSPIWYSIDNSEWKHVTALSSSSKSWGISSAIVWMKLAIADFTAGKHSISFKVNEYRRDGGYAYMIDAVSLLKDPYIRLNLPPVFAGDSTGNVFVQSGRTVFHLKYKVADQKLQWRVLDWMDKECAKGTWNTKDNKLVLPKLQIGYYVLQTKTADKQSWDRGVPFTRVVDPESRVRDVKSPFAVDSAQSWAGTDSNNPIFRLQPANVNEIISDLEYLAGISSVRDRYGWIEASPGKIEFPDTYIETSDMLAKRGVQVTRVFHNAPEWACQDKALCPNDLLAVYKFTKASAEKYKNTVQAWEFWNEQDAAGYAINAWEFAAAQKAAYLGFKAGNPKANVLVGSSCGHPVPRFMDMLMENGAGEYFDTYNFHLYSTLDQYPLVVKDEYDLLKRHGAANKPVWITENGFCKGGTGEPLAEGSTLMEYTPREQRDQAEYLVKSQILLQSMGVEKDFSFIFRPYNETNIAWGMLRWDYTPKIAYAAFANLTAKLAGCKYLGEVKLGSGIRAFLYQQRDKKQTLVYWSDKGGSFKLNDISGKIYKADLVGGVNAISGNTIKADKYPAYIRNLSGLKIDASIKPIVRHKASPVSSKELAVVVQLQPKDGFSNFTKNMVTIDSKKSAQAILNVYNLGEKAKSGNILNYGKGYTITGLPSNVNLPPMEKISIPVNIKMTSSQLTKFRLGGKFEGKSISPVCVQLLPSDVQIDPSLKAKTISTFEAKRWKHNSSGDIKITDDPEENAVRVDLEFKPNTDHWAYPSFSIKPDESLAGAAGVSFEIKSKWIDPRGFAAALLMIGMDERLDGGVMHYFPYTPKTEWQTVYLSFDAEAPVAFNTGDIKRLAIGANPVQNSYTYWLRNIKAYYK